MNLILIAVISLGAIALVLAAILYVASKKFAVAIRVVAVLPTLASKPARWMENSAP